MPSSQAQKHQLEGKQTFSLCSFPSVKILRNLESLAHFVISKTQAYLDLVVFPYFQKVRLYKNTFNNFSIVDLQIIFH